MKERADLLGNRQETPSLGKKALVLLLSEIRVGPLQLPGAGSCESVLQVSVDSVTAVAMMREERERIPGSRLTTLPGLPSLRRKLSSNLLVKSFTSASLSGGKPPWKRKNRRNRGSPISLP